MTLSDLIRELCQRGIIINMDGSYNLKIKSLVAPIHEELLERLRQKKPEVISYLSKAYSLKHGMEVTTPNGVGRIWEFYPAIDRCGVIIGDYDLPQFFSILEVEVGNVQARRVP